MFRLAFRSMLPQKTSLLVAHCGMNFAVTIVFDIGSRWCKATSLGRKLFEIVATHILGMPDFHMTCLNFTWGKLAIWYSDQFFFNAISPAFSLFRFTNNLGHTFLNGLENHFCIRNTDLIISSTKWNRHSYEFVYLLLNVCNCFSFSVLALELQTNFGRLFLQPCLR